MFRNYQHRGEVFAAAVQRAGERGGRAADASTPRRAPQRRVRPLRSLWAALLLLALGLVMVYSASIAIAEASRFTGSNAGLLPAAPRRCSSRVGARAPASRVPGAAAALAAGRAVAVPRRRGAARAGADPGHRARGERRAPLAAAGRRQPAALRADEARSWCSTPPTTRCARHALHARASSAGFLPMFGGDAAWSAWLLLREPDFGAFVVIAAIAIGDPVPRRHELAGCFAGAARACSRVGFVAADPVLALPHAAHLRLHGPVGRRVRQGLPAVARADRLRPRRMARRGPGRQRREAVLPARGAHRFPARGDRRGTRLRRRGRW